MARKDDSRQATETLEEISSFFDDGADWVASHPQLVLSVLGAVLLCAGGLGYWSHATEQRRLEASEAVGLVQAEYLQAMGAGPLSGTFAEPANEETARATRREFAARLSEAAAQHPGTSAALAGQMEAAALLARAGDTEEALEIWRALGAADAGRSALSAFALQRLARALEAAGEPAEASRVYERAARSPRYPEALQALGHAARSAADAGERERALALFDEIEAQKPEDGAENSSLPWSLSIPEHLSARLRELRISPEDARGVTYDAALGSSETPPPPEL